MYIALHWAKGKEEYLYAVSADPKLYAIQKFHSMQGQKDAGSQWYHLLKDSLENMGLHHSVAYHVVFTWK
jgi:hypothetical protein